MIDETQKDISHTTTTRQLKQDLKIKKAHTDIDFLHVTSLFPKPAQSLLLIN